MSLKWTFPLLQEQAEHLRLLREARDRLAHHRVHRIALTRRTCRALCGLDRRWSHWPGRLVNGRNPVGRQAACSAVPPRGGHRGTSLIRNTPPVGPYSSPMPRGTHGDPTGGVFLMSEVPLQPGRGSRGALPPQPVLLCDSETVHCFVPQLRASLL